MEQTSVSKQEVSAIIEFIRLLNGKLSDIQTDLTTLKADVATLKTETKQIKDDIQVVGKQLGLERSERGNLWKPTY